MARQKCLLPLDDQQIMSDLRTAVGISVRDIVWVSFDGLIESQIDISLRTPRVIFTARHSSRQLERFRIGASV